MARLSLYAAAERSLREPSARAIRVLRMKTHVYRTRRAIDVAAAIACVAFAA